MLICFYTFRLVYNIFKVEDSTQISKLNDFLINGYLNCFQIIALSTVLDCISIKDQCLQVRFLDVKLLDHRRWALTL